MISHRDSFDDIRGRLLRLEKENRRFKQLGVAALIVPALLIVMGQAPSKKTVEANEFILRDDGGNIRARLFVTQKAATTMTLPGMTMPVMFAPNATLALYDEKGQTKVILNDSDITFENAQGHLGGSLGSGILSLQGSGDSSFALLTPYNLSLSDADGFSATLGSSNLVSPRTGETQKTSAASLVMFGKNKNVIWKAP
jgi:hypothetical protein